MFAISLCEKLLFENASVSTSICVQKRLCVKTAVSKSSCVQRLLFRKALCEGCSV